MHGLVVQGVLVVVRLLVVARLVVLRAGLLGLLPVRRAAGLLPAVGRLAVRLTLVLRATLLLTLGLLSVLRLALLLTLGLLSVLRLAVLLSTIGRLRLLRILSFRPVRRLILPVG
ncbi:hypothetical protein ABT236_24540 [Streptomyces sp. NPDC001523]|uniref:hypothetical protein n=1 Tax=Streptomyces sp. NPDC001523 TaxID=3154383 RepID=UPI00331B2ED4